MNRGRIGAAAVFSAVIVIVLIVIVYVETLNSSKTISVFILSKDVPAGTVYAPENAQQTMIKAQDGAFAFETRAPGDFAARYATTMHAGDIVRDDDLVALQSQSEIALPIAKSPALNPGDNIDIYAIQGDSALLIGTNVKVLSGSGTITVLVSSKDESNWAAISSGANINLLAVRSSGGPAPQTRCRTVRSAIAALSGTAGTGAPSICDTGANPTP